MGCHPGGGRSGCAWTGSIKPGTTGLAALREGPEHCQWRPLLSCDNLACLQTVTNVTERPAEDTSPPFENPRQTNMEL